MSAGRHWLSGMSEGNSFRGAKAADWAAEKIASRIGLWRKILSPLLGLLFHISPQRIVLKRFLSIILLLYILYFAALIIITSNKFFSVFSIS